MSTPARHALARLIWALHVAIVAFFLVGWALPWRWALWTVAVGAVVLQVGWWLCNDVCWLTLLEERLKGAPEAPPPGTREEAEAAPNFVSALVDRILGRPMPESRVNAVIYGIVWGGFTIAVARLWLGRAA